MDTDHWRDGVECCLLKHHGLAFLTSHSPPSPHPFWPLQSSLHCLLNGISTQPKVQGPPSSTPISLSILLRLLPSKHYLLQSSSLSPLTLPCLCSLAHVVPFLELHSPPHLYPARRLFPHPPGSRSSPIFPEASPAQKD